MSAELPAGTPHYWADETLYVAHVRSAVWALDVKAGSEVPKDVTGQPLCRHGNRWWPSYVSIDRDDDSLMLWPDQARTLAHALLAAADVAQSVDDADTDACGHWAPCDCGAR